ncbi:MAG: hypothetical protein E6Q97_28775 [Desulfurellales bacterium]|jgi:hypothetical protein|nr:MAG: hypothetical protein E6Q97_28775 [Desulfurellales bacterium]
MMTCLLFALSLVASADGTCSAHGDCKLGERCENRVCMPHKPRGDGEAATLVRHASDCNPGRKDPPKEGDKPPPPVYNPKV